jgi:hypothetical protein
MDAPTYEIACREVIANWRRLAELAGFAELLHGFGNSDGGFGIAYPEDLDEYDIHVGMTIPEGMIEVYAYTSADPPGYEMLVAESRYLRVLADVLREHGLSDEAIRVRAVIDGRLSRRS